MANNSHSSDSTLIFLFRKCSTRLTALIAALMILSTFAIGTFPVAAMEDQYGPICLRWYTPTQLQVQVGDTTSFEIRNFVPSTILFVEIWEIEWGDGATNFSSSGEQLTPGQSRFITHAYSNPGTYTARFEWNGGFYFPDGTYKRPVDYEPGTCNHEQVYFQVVVSSGSQPPSSPPSIQISAVNLSPPVTEGNQGTKPFSFIVQLSHPSATTITVDYRTVDGKATAPSDYEAGKGTIIFSPGQITKTVEVNVLGDRLVEDDEDFSVKLSNPVGATLDIAEVPGLIINNDLPPTAHFRATMRSGGLVDLDASNSGPDVIGYDWSFSDGIQLSTGTPKTQHKFDTFGAVTVTLTVTDRFGNRSAPYNSQQLNACAPDVPPIDLLEYAALVRCVEEVLPDKSPRVVLATMRKLYFGGEKWAAKYDPRWNNIIPCSISVPNPTPSSKKVPNPTPILSTKLYTALIQAQDTVGEGDPSHIFTGLEALECPSRSVRFPLRGRDLVTVHMPNYLIATWGGDVGSAAGMKSYDEWRAEEQPWSYYFGGPKGIRSSAKDMNGDLDGLVLGYAIAREPCFWRPELWRPKPEKWTLPLSEYIKGYVNKVPTIISDEYSRDRVRCFANILRASTPSGHLDRARMHRMYGHMVHDFAETYFAAQDPPFTLGVYTTVKTYILVRDRSFTAIDLFTDWVNAQP